MSSKDKLLVDLKVTMKSKGNTGINAIRSAVLQAENDRRASLDDDGVTVGEN